jgi:hypothetical protein
MAVSLPAPIQLEVNRRFNWKVFAILLAASVVGFVSVLPYTFTIQSETLKTTQLPLPLPLVLVIQGVQNAVLFAVVGGLGYLLATKIGLGLPFVEGWLNGQPIWNDLPRIALVAAVGGVVAGLVIVAADQWVFGPPMEALLKASGVTLPASISPPAWQGFLASFYGGIVEETLLRLGVLTLLAWLGQFASRTPDNRPTLGVLWIANILAAILFGLGHLPTTALVGIPITPLVVARAVVLNGVIGVFAGWLYWRWGLESAIVAHFSADIILHVLLPLAAGGLA